MRVALDVTSAVKPRPTGIGRYIDQLVRALEPRLGAEDRLFLCTRLSRWSERRHRLRPTRPAQVYLRWFQEPLPPRGGAEVFHALDARMFGRAGYPRVVTVHDVVSLLSDEFDAEAFREKKKARYAEIATQANRIIFVSDAARWEFEARFPDAAGRGVVIHHGVDPAFCPRPAAEVAAVRARYRLPDRFALYVGNVGVRKNLPGMARGLAASGTGLPWVWIGQDAYRADAIRAEVAAISGIDVVRPGYLPFDDLPALYAAATVLTFATHHEGFGLPALEAMACGTPVVAADCGALPEVVGDAAVCVAPTDPDAIGAAIRRIATDAAYAADLVRRARERARTFTWERAARETLAVYRDLLGMG